MSDPTDPRELPKGSCGHRRGDGSRCTQPVQYRVIFFKFSEGPSPEMRHRISCCAKHLGRTVFRVCERYGADKVTIFPRAALESPEEAGAAPMSAADLGA